MRLIESLEQKYNQYRLAQTRGTSQVSPYFFNIWKNTWFRNAFDYLKERSKSLGKEGANPTLKAIATLVGCGFVAYGFANIGLPLVLYGHGRSKQRVGGDDDFAVPWSSDSDTYPLFHLYGELAKKIEEQNPGTFGNPNKE